MKFQSGRHETYPRRTGTGFCASLNRFKNRGEADLVRRPTWIGSVVRRSSTSAPASIPAGIVTVLWLIVGMYNCSSIRMRREQFIQHVTFGNAGGPPSVMIFKLTKTAHRETPRIVVPGAKLLLRRPTNDL